MLTKDFGQNESYQEYYINHELCTICRHVGNMFFLSSENNLNKRIILNIVLRSCWTVVAIKDWIIAKIETRESPEAIKLIKEVF